MDLANAYGSFPYQLITFTLSFFYIPPCIYSLVANYFNNFHVCYQNPGDLNWLVLAGVMDSNGLLHLSHPFRSSI